MIFKYYKIESVLPERKIRLLIPYCFGGYILARTLIGCSYIDDKIK